MILTAKKPILITIAAISVAILGGTYFATRYKRQHRPTVIFDLDGVLFRTSKTAGFKKLGMSNVLKYAFGGNSPGGLQDKAFEIMRLLRKETTNADPNYPTYHGAPLPSIMIDWQKATKTNKEILDELLIFVEELDRQDYFANKTEKQLIINVFHIMFVPEERIDMTKPMKQGIKLLEQCKAAGYQVYMLSNIDTEGMALLQEKYPDIFKLFDGMVTSCGAREVKPYPTIYKHLLTRYDLNPACCTFLDNEKENIEGAKKVGINGILVTKKSLRTLNKKIEQLEVLTA